MEQWRRATILQWNNLPPLPMPQYDVMRSQSRKGRLFVTACVATGLSVIHASVILGGLSLPVSQIILLAAWTEAVVALFCLVQVQRLDPGVIERSEERCSPLPQVVRERILEGQSLTGLTNIDDHDHGSFCVRCLLWRRAGEKAHHCSICQRCTTNFDHHCHVLGCCIAGKALAGNMGYFRVLDAMAWSGLTTACLAMFMATVEALGWESLAKVCIVLCIGIQIITHSSVKLGFSLQRAMTADPPLHRSTDCDLESFSIVVEEQGALHDARKRRVAQLCSRKLLQSVAERSRLRHDGRAQFAQRCHSVDLGELLENQQRAEV